MPPHSAQQFLGKLHTGSDALKLPPKQCVSSAAIVIALAAVLLVLAMVQYRWSTQMSEVAGMRPLIRSLPMLTSASRPKMTSATLVGNSIDSVPEIATTPAAIFGS